MSDPAVLRDEQIAALFQARARRGELIGLADVVIQATAGVRQRRGWLERLRTGSATPPSRLLVLAALALGTVGLLAAVGAITRPPDPSDDPRRAVASTFARQFSYVVPTWDDVRRVDEVQDYLFGFQEATDGEQPSRYGVVVAALTTAVVHECPGDGRATIRMDPAGLLADMASAGGIRFSTPVEATFDGRPSLVARRTENSHACETADLHIGDLPIGGRPFLPMGSAATSIVLEVDARTIFIDIWADTSERLASWLPTATEFVNSIHFTTASPTASPTASRPNPVRVTGFVRPFDYTPLIGDLTPVVGALSPDLVTVSGGIRIASAETAWVHWCLHDDRSPVRADPAGFLADLGDIAGLNMGPAVSTTLDGRAAMQSDYSPAGSRCTGDIHLNGGGINLGDYFRLNLPARFIVADIDGVTIFVQIEGADDAALATLLPDAMRFVDGIHFAARP